MSRFAVVGVGVSCLLSGALVAAGAPAATVTQHRIDEDFSAATLDTSTWSVVQLGSDTTVGVRRGALAVSVTGAPSDFFDAGISANCQVRGDFNVRVSYSLRNWPAADGVNAGLIASPAGGVSTRLSTAAGDVYAGLVDPSAYRELPTGDLQGQFRFVRRGATGTAYARGDETQPWTRIVSGPVAPDDTYVGVGIYGNTTGGPPFGHQPLSVRFDDFHLRADALVC